MELAQKIGRTGRTVRPKPRPKGNRAQKTKVRTTGNLGNAFLKQRFPPLIENQYEEMCRQMLIERGFKNSLSNLCNLYGWHVPELADQPFPANISPALQRATALLKAENEELKLRFFFSEDGAKLATVKTFNTDMTLFYFPIEPVTGCTIAGKRRRLGKSS